VDISIVGLLTKMAIVRNMRQKRERKKMTEPASSGGIGFLGLLTILFVALKLTGYIDWSWLWILSPVWIPIVLFVVFFVLAVGIRGFSRKY